MPAAKKSTGCDYSTELRKLKNQGPQRIYLLWGPEDYLRSYFLDELKKICIPQGDDGFSYKKFAGPSLDCVEFSNSVNMMPFMSDRTFIEIDSLDFGKLSDQDMFLRTVSDIPDFCTVALVFPSEYEFDGRLKIVKSLRSISEDLYFQKAGGDVLRKWIAKRFSAEGKSIRSDAVDRLIFISGDSMNGLIPEISKIAGYAKGDTVTAEDVNAVANHIPEADTFEMVNAVSSKNFDTAVRVLSEIMQNKDYSPIAVISALGYQLRRLYITKYALSKNYSTSQIMSLLGAKTDYQVKQVVSAAKAFTLRQIRNAVESCVDSEFQMKSSLTDENEILQQTLTGIIIGDLSAKA